MKRTFVQISFVVFAAVLLLNFTACNSAKQVAYFQDVYDSTNVEKRVRHYSFVEPLIHKGDVLNVEVSTLDATIGGLATSVQGEKENMTPNSIVGYTVDKDGYIEIPIVGRLKVEGITTAQAKEVVRKAALRYYKDPMVNVRLSNFVITVLGAVNEPGRYTVPTEKINIVDALGMAGDLLISGKRNNVMIIREIEGEAVFTRIDLNSTDVFKSEYYYLQPGDKIYVEPIKAFARSGTKDKRADRYISIALGLVSIGIALINILTR